MKEFDLESLAEFNGRDGKPVYVACRGKVYDVSKSKMWKEGSHMRRHYAGEDLTDDIQSAPHTVEMLSKFPQVGVMKQPQEDQPIIKGKA